VDPDQLSAFSETARRFAHREVTPMVGSDHRDGNLDALPALLTKAESVGLLSVPSPESPGHEFGVWGRACLTHGSQFSLKILEEIAKACAGVASCLHFIGLASLEMAEFPDPPKRAAVAFFEDHWRLSWETLKQPPLEATRLEARNGQYSLTGSKPFVQTGPGCEAFLVYTRDESVWRRALIPKDARGLVSSDPGQRTGLAALEVNHLSFEKTPVDPKNLLPPNDPSSFLQRLLLGLCAIAVGNAKGALEAARIYAADRYQGGAQIEKHPAIHILMGEATSRIYACSAQLLAEAERAPGSRDVLWRAFAAKLRIPADCSQAVTDCLQILGGYGYMEDFRQEKRLRDALTLKSMGISPMDLRLLCATDGPGGLGLGS
jgi:alkylation response protein AidB-like acyl-CoA dehydrogenase